MHWLMSLNLIRSGLTSPSDRRPGDPAPLHPPRSSSRPPQCPRAPAAGARAPSAGRPPSSRCARLSSTPPAVLMESEGRKGTRERVRRAPSAVEMVGPRGVRWEVCCENERLGRLRWWWWWWWWSWWWWWWWWWVYESMSLFSCPNRPNHLNTPRIEEANCVRSEPKARKVSLDLSSAPSSRVARPVVQ